MKKLLEGTKPRNDRQKPQPLSTTTNSSNTSKKSSSSSKFTIYSSAKIAPHYIPNEDESLTVSIPTTQTQLNQIILEMSNNRNDRFGRERLLPNKADWQTVWDDLPLLNEKGDCIAILSTELVYPPIFYGDYTSVFSIKSDPHKVIRYHLHRAPMEGSLDPTVLDYWMLKRIEATNIAPKVYYYSASVDPNEYDQSGELIALAGPGKTNQTKVQTKEDNKDVKPLVRYAIMEKVGLSIFKYIMSQPDERLSFTDAIRLGGQMINILQTLHSLEIVHCDCHMGNFAIHNNKIVILDFGRAKLIHKTELSDRHSRFEGDFVHSPWISPWEMQRYIPSYRDDVFRVLLGIALAIYGGSYASYWNHICQLRNVPDTLHKPIYDHVIQIKTTGQIFEIPQLNISYPLPPIMLTAFTLQGVVPDIVLEDVRRLFNEIVNEVLNVNIFTKPNYSIIKSKLLVILMLVEEKVDPQSIKPDYDPFQMTFTLPPSNMNQEAVDS